MEASDDPLLHGDVPAPAGAVNTPDSLDPAGGPFVETGGAGSRG